MTNRHCDRCNEVTPHYRVQSGSWFDWVCSKCKSVLDRKEPKVKCAFHSAVPVWGWPVCSGPSTLQQHHVINKSRLAGNKEAKRLVEGEYKKIFIRWVCAKHNTDRYADMPYARAFLVRQWGALAEHALEEIRACFKSDTEDLRYEALIMRKPK